LDVRDRIVGRKRGEGRYSDLYEIQHEHRPVSRADRRMNEKKRMRKGKKVSKNTINFGFVKKG
jgi:hypothetical protein